MFSATPWYFRLGFSPEGSISGKMLRPSPGTGNAPCSEVVNEGLATRFAEKLAQMRCDSQGQFVTPSLVFHGAPSQELLCVVLPQLATAITDIDLKRDASGTAGLNRRLSTFQDFEVLDVPVKWLIAFSRQQWVTPKARSSKQELSRQWAWRACRKQEVLQESVAAIYLAAAGNKLRSSITSKLVWQKQSINEVIQLQPNSKKSGHVSAELLNWGVCLLVLPAGRCALSRGLEPMAGKWILPCLLLCCSACDLTGWLNEEAEADHGYNILCVTDVVTVYVTWLKLLCWCT